ncbi:MAG: ATP-dependent RNA helicase DeaD [Candidatus Anoxychlamydiales bacterium]|nr:ATP-dependent RNA helicase DeaD [Candidatus Anoxychlamydiales bacterium]
MTFKNLNLHSKVIQAIEEMKYEIATPIQEQSIPEILNGKDLFACAQTGTGKTAAFFLPTLTKLMEKPLKGKGPRILVLVPTRELAMQVSKEATKFSKYLKMIKTVCIYGGVPYPQQRRDLHRPYEILVATPGRLIDHINSGRIKFSRLETFILDEADRMLDMGFIDDVRRIADAIETEHQTLLFSATLKKAIKSLVKDLLKDPVDITIPVDKENIEQRIHTVRNLDHKLELLDKVLNDEEIKQAIIFTSTKIYADELKYQLQEKGHRAQALHGDIPQGKRTRIIAQFRHGKTDLLIATDVAARGIDIPKISHIINFDLPNSIEDYIHRIGRTGRIGEKGLAISFASPKDRGILFDIEKLTGQKLLPSRSSGNRRDDNKNRFSKNFSRKRNFSNRDNDRDSRKNFSRKSSNRDDDRNFSSNFKRKSSNRDDDRDFSSNFKRKSSNRDDDRDFSSNFKRKSSNRADDRNFSSNFKRKPSSNRDDDRNFSSNFKRKPSSNRDDDRNFSSNFKRKSSNRDDDRDFSKNFKRKSSNRDDDRDFSKNFKRKSSSNRDDDRGFPNKKRSFKDKKDEREGKESNVRSFSKKGSFRT